MAMACPGSLFKQQQQPNIVAALPNRVPNNKHHGGEEHRSARADRMALRAMGRRTTQGRSTHLTRGEFLRHHMIDVTHWKSKPISFYFQQNSGI